MKLNRLILIAAALATVLATSCGGNDESAMDEPVDGNDMVTAARSLITTIDDPDFSYSAASAFDGNLASCWAANLYTAQQEKRYDGKSVEAMVVTLAGPHIGSIVVWSGHWKSNSLFLQNSSAAAITLKDYSDGKVIFESAISEYPFVKTVGKTLEECSDGKYRVQINFGSENFPGVRDGSKYDDLCISEIQFFADEKAIPIYPLGDRAAMGLRGPVKDCDGVSFDIDGMTHFYSNSMISFPATGVVLKSQLKGAKGTTYKCTESYNLNGSLRERISDFGEGKVKTESFEYDDSGMLVKESINQGKSNSFILYGYSDGQMVKKEVYDNTASEPKLVSSEEYEVLTKDKYGNWTSRKVLSKDKVETRVISYF